MLEKKPLHIVIFVAIACLLWTIAASGHRLNVFCWTENGKIRCESSFSGGKPVHRGQTRVLTSEGNELFSGKTDEKGRFDFPVPEKYSGDLKVEVDAGVGHKGSWPVKAGEYQDIKATPGKTEQGGKPEATKSPPPASGKKISNSERQKRQGLLQKTVRQELAPVKKQLAKLRRDRITAEDIFSGIGYILGLMGIALYFQSKRDKR